MGSATGEFMMGGFEGKVESSSGRGRSPAIKPAVRRALEIRREKEWLRHQLEDALSDGPTDLEELGW